MAQTKDIELGWLVRPFSHTVEMVYDTFPTAQTGAVNTAGEALAVNNAGTPYAKGDSSIVFDGGTESDLRKGDTVKFGADTAPYTIVSVTWSSEGIAGTMVVTPVLTTDSAAAAANEAAITVTKTIGLHELPVDGFTLEESEELDRNFDNGLPCYCKIGATDTTNYRVIYFETNPITSRVNRIWVYPKVQATPNNDDAITIGGSTISIDIGTIGEAGVKMTHELEEDSVIDEMGEPVSTLQRIKKISVELDTVTMTVENFLMLCPNSFYTVTDQAVTYNYGYEIGDYAYQPSGKVVIKPKNDPTNISKTITLSSVIQKNRDLNWQLSGTDRTKSISLTFDSKSGCKFLIGTSTAAYVAP